MYKRSITGKLYYFAKQKVVILLHNNSRAHYKLKHPDKKLSLGWQPPEISSYSSELVSADFHILIIRTFHKWQNIQKQKKLK